MMYRGMGMFISSTVLFVCTELFFAHTEPEYANTEMALVSKERHASNIYFFSDKFLLLKPALIPWLGMRAGTAGHRLA